jgi:hypothetical protein
MSDKFKHGRRGTLKYLAKHKVPKFRKDRPRSRPKDDERIDRRYDEYADEE